MTQLNSRPYAVLMERSIFRRAMLDVPLQPETMEAYNFQVVIALKMVKWKIKFWFWFITFSILNRV